MNFVRKVPLTSELPLGWGEGRSSRGDFATYGRSPKKPTVGFFGALWKGVPKSGRGDGVSPVERVLRRVGEEGLLFLP